MMWQWTVHGKASSEFYHMFTLGSDEGPSDYFC